MDGVGGLRGWQWLFILEGSITAVYGIVLKVHALFNSVLRRVETLSMLYATGSPHACCCP